MIFGAKAGELDIVKYAIENGSQISYKAYKVLEISNHKNDKQIINYLRSCEINNTTLEAKAPHLKMVK